MRPSAQHSDFKALWAGKDLDSLDSIFDLEKTALRRKCIHAAIIFAPVRGGQINASVQLSEVLRSCQCPQTAGWVVISCRLVEVMPDESAYVHKTLA
jgi:hypothetical protein